MPRFDTDFFLNELPEANFQQFIQRRLPQNRRRFYTDKFAEVQRHYLRALAGFAADNPGVSPINQPELNTFSKFLQGGYDFDDLFYDTPRRERGGDSAFDARTRYLFPG